MRKLRHLGALVLATSVALSAATPAEAQLGRWFFGERAPAYALDDVDRRDPRGFSCAPEQMTSYRGTTIRWSSPVRVHPAFAERLPELERVAAEVATEVYGRAPSKVLHAGGYNCRPVRGNVRRLSEHALGNAIDVRGFELRALPRRAAAPEGLPRALRRGFTVTLDRHWLADSETGRVHARFLRLLVERLSEQDVFRVIYGPAHPGHRSHFHFDMSPFRWIHV